MAIATEQRPCKIGQLPQMAQMATVVAPVAPAVQNYTLQVPAGVGPGTTMQFQLNDGRTAQVQVPAGVPPGGVFTVQA